jgi:hypothetical protein
LSTAFDKSPSVKTDIQDIPIFVPIIGFGNKKCKRNVKVELCILMAGHIG